MAYQNVIYSKEGHIATVQLNRPQRLNALDSVMPRELGAVFYDMELDKEVWIVILTGDDRAFSAGADIREDRPPEWLRGLNRLFNRIEAFEKPVIAAVNGYCLGGGLELALCCDIIIAAETAQFGMAEMKIGAIPGAGGTQRLPRAVGMLKAKELIFSGDPIDGKEAYRIGLANKVVPPGKVLEEARKLALTLIDRPPLTMRRAKYCVNVGMNMALPEALEWAEACIAAQPPTKDAVEGRLAFREKRKPAWRGE